ncbi:TetR/AcrR family transcriptional regulator C-terminal domain-containing protein [Kitasatospora sp. NPDC057015]|uniref:TetR/AcrR family transcriptional regulator C-terminal domain-containing protein n=1 Tax=Kitasatospora sp. NPDC057015 TaxID=3346001 RepID=UPI00362E0CE4
MTTGEGPGPGQPAASARIVAELRRRIEAGELAAGDRVPSTRQITQEWGVAMATATKALTALRQEGLVRAVPGVGTVVREGPPGVLVPPAAVAPPAALAPPAPVSAPVRGPVPDPAAVPPHPSAPAPAPARSLGYAPDTRPARGADRELTQERIVRTAVAIADAEGLSALAMRRIAAELGAATMSLYRHVADKGQLIRLMMDRVLTENPLPEDFPSHWRAGLETVARTQWRVYGRHPWLAPATSFTRPVPSPHAAIHTERSIAVLVGGGLALGEAAQAAVTLAAFVCGLAVNFETEAAAVRDSGISAEEWMDSQEEYEDEDVFADPARFPMFHALQGGPEVGLDLESLFEFGLARMLDGFGTLIALRTGRA